MIPTKIIIHHSASGFNTTLVDIEIWHKVRFNFKSSLGLWSGYHYIIFPDGAIKQTRRDNELGAHSIANDGKIGICLIGNFEITEPKEGQLNSLLFLLEKIKKEYNISEVLGHRDCNKTDCPGKNLYKYTTLFTKINWLQRIIRKFLTPKTHA